LSFDETFEKYLILVKVKACEKNNFRHIFNIPRIIFECNADIGQKDHLWMATIYE